LSGEEGVLRRMARLPGPDTERMLERRLRRTVPNPARLLAMSFAAAISVGTVLLSLPAATVDGRGLTLIDALFEATSATCVTGLTVVNTAADLSLFGQLVVLMLIQIGALGIMTVTTLFAYAVGRQVSLASALTLGEELGQPRLAGVLMLTRNVAILTFLIESAGALVLTALFSRCYPLGRAAYLGIFHSISAFCNAGFDIFGSSLVGFTTDIPVNLVMMTLIILGGLGFYVITELVGRRNSRRLSLHTRVVLKSTGALILVGTVLVLLFESANPETLGPLSPIGRVVAALFQAVTPRTAGFNTVATGSLMPSTLLILMILMFIGASPGSTGGGVKTTTFVAVLASVRSVLRRRDDVEIEERRLPSEVAAKALAITLLALTVILTAAVVLLATEEAPLTDVLFETFSAVGTVGLSTGLTPELSSPGRVLISLLMYTGRIGPLTVLVALSRKKAAAREWHLPEGRIIVG